MSGKEEALRSKIKRLEKKVADLTVSNDDLKSSAGAWATKWATKHLLELRRHDRTSEALKNLIDAAEEVLGQVDIEWDKFNGAKWVTKMAALEDGCPVEAASYDDWPANYKPCPALHGDQRCVLTVGHDGYHTEGNEVWWHA